MTEPYPLIFEPVLLDKVWGGDRLKAFGKAVKPGGRIGESWELADLASTAAGGAGGQAIHSRIANGPMAGRTIREALAQWGRRAAGDLRLMPDGGFPLLVKFLDARENLSVQVHPSPAYAACTPGAHVKSECWYILDADPGSLIYKGIRPGVTAESFRSRIASGEVVNDVIAVPAVRGDCHLLPSGTCHALGAGVLVAEVQTASDTTFRVYDWGRTGRELHIDPALRCIDWSPACDAARLPEGRRVARLVKTDAFAMDECLVRIGESEPASVGPSCSIVIVLEGEGELLTPGAGAVHLRTGSTALIPAAIAPSTTFKAMADSRLLRVAPA